MRLFFTLLLTALFVAATAVLTLADGAGRTLADADAVVKAADQAGVRSGIVDAAEDLIVEEVSRDPRLIAPPRGQLHAVIDGVLAPDWFAASLRRAHLEIWTALGAAWPSSVIDLTATKQELRRVIDELERRVDEACASLLAEAECPSRRGVKERADEARRALRTVADQADLAALVSRSEAEQARVRGWLSRVPQARWYGAGVLALLLVLILLVNLGSLRRVLVALGLALLAATAASVPLHALAADRVRDELERRVGEPLVERDPTFARRVPVVTARFAASIVDGAARAARTPLLGLAVVGVVLLGGAVLAGGGRERAT